MSLKNKIQNLKMHPLMQVLADNGGNPRTLVLIEPLWGIPYNLIAPFATLYMYTAGHHRRTDRIDSVDCNGISGNVLLFWRHIVG